MSVQKGYMSPYVSSLQNYKSRNQNLGPTARKILGYFITEPPLSAYDVFRIMKPSGYFNSYKNIHKRVHRLLVLKLITKDKNYKSKRGAIKYKLTPEGIYYLISTTIFFFKDDVKGLFSNYGDDEFFRHIVYPYLSRETILMMTDEVFFIDLSMHMRDCCYQLNAIADYEEESRRLDTVPKSEVPAESPLKQITLQPLPLMLINSCKFLNQNDLRALTYDVRFMKELNKQIDKCESIRNTLLKLRRTA